MDHLHSKKMLQYATKLDSVLESICLDDPIDTLWMNNKHKITEVATDVCGIRKVV